MVSFRAAKAALKPVLEQSGTPGNSPDCQPDWSPDAVWAVWGGSIPGLEAVGPLFAFLAGDETVRWRAVAALGQLAAHRLATAPEGKNEVREIVRRLMWRLNEDSGNLGWGSAEAMGEILAMGPDLAAEYGRILFSYVRDTGHADNYLDHPGLRQGAYWGIARLAAAPAFAWTPLQEEAFSLLLDGLKDTAPPCRAVAAWGLGHIAARRKDVPGTLREAARTALAALTAPDASQARAFVLEGVAVRENSAAAFAGEALAVLAG